MNAVSDPELIISDEAGARQWIAALPDVSRGTFDQLDRLAVLTAAESEKQNLVAASTLGPAFWCRHILDSAQLLRFAPQYGTTSTTQSATSSPTTSGGSWIDLGSGAGFPGIVVAIVAPCWAVTLVESRSLRCEFLARAVDDLGLSDRVTVRHCSVESLETRAHDVISARAFAPLERLLRVSAHLAGDKTRWLLPKGRNAAIELSTLAPLWQTAFEVQPSITDGESQILVGRGRIVPRPKQRKPKRRPNGTFKGK